MARIHFKVFFSPKQLLSRIRRRYEYIKLCGKSLMYNKHVNQSYVADVCLEPLFWFVDNFAHLLGPFCIVAVACLTTTVVGIAYWIGLPYWWYKSKIMTVILLVVGNWLLINVIFHYYKAAITPAGYPPTEAFIPEAVSMCKKCIAPKPPRTHHCSICNRCILKMDHHCPWLNNCVGFGNHRYFYLYMVFTTIGCFFLVLFGLDIGISVLFYGDNLMFTSDTHLLGHPVHINKTGHLIPIETEYDENILEQEHRDLPIPSNLLENKFMFRALLFMAFICIGVILALGTLLIWHGRLITRGETSVEALINKLETKRLSALNQIYVNPYDFGPKKNWKLFLGLVKGRNFVRHVLFPSAHSPEGSGLTFPTVYEISDMA